MQELYQRPHSPFDDTAIERLRRMGLVTAEDRPDRDVLAVFSTIFAGQFYDDLCDYYQDYTDVRELLTLRRMRTPSKSSCLSACNTTVCSGTCRTPCGGSAASRNLPSCLRTVFCLICGS